MDKIKQYTQTICEQIRWKKAHIIISEEIENHILDQKNAFIKSGINEDIATNKAILEMGDAVFIGMELDRTHRPKIELSVLFLTSLAILLGIGVQLVLPNNNDFFTKILPNIIIGFVCMWVAYLVDFTVFGKYPKILYSLFLFFSLTLTIVLYQPGKMLFYIRYIMLFFPIIFVGIIYKCKNKGYLGIMISILAFVFPIIFNFFYGNFFTVFLVTTNFLIVMTYSINKNWFNVKKLHGFLILYVPSFLGLLVALFQVFLQNGYRLKRILSFINPFYDKYGNGYLNIMVREIIASSKFIGKCDYFLDLSENLPSVNIEYVLTYLIGTFGFISIIIIMLVLASLIGRLIFLSKKQKNVLAKLISISIISSFLLQTIPYIFSNFGFLLIAPFDIPFISYGGFSNIINMTMMGIIMSVFKTGYIVKENESYSENIQN